jgi:V8-like Glu-specific endopeptidase
MASISVQVQTPDSFGSGAFIARNLLVTAAHVIHPRDQGDPYPVKKLTVVLWDAIELAVVGRLCHPRWAAGFDATGDMAILRVAEDQPGLVLGWRSNLSAVKRPVTITGFREGPNTGTVTRVSNPNGADAFHSDDLAFHEGVSGAPVIAATGQAIGIATRSPGAATADSFIGIPFLDTTQEKNLSWLIANCPSPG